VKTGKDLPVTGETAGEGPYDITVSGSGAQSGLPVSASDDASVEAPLPVPEIKVTKLAGPPDGCTATGIANVVMQDDTYNLPTRTSEWIYCYLVEIPSTTEECLNAISMTDPAPGATAGEIPVAGPMCAGESKYIPGDLVNGLEGPEGPFYVTITGTGVISGKDASYSDPATVIPPAPVPKLKITKYAAPVGPCANANTAAMFDVLYTLADRADEWQYCYRIEVPSTSEECLGNMELSDAAPSVTGNSVTVPVMPNAPDGAVMCPGDVQFIEAEVINGLTEEEGP
jgi:hypothetical protein